MESEKTKIEGMTTLQVQIPDENSLGKLVEKAFPVRRLADGLIELWQVGKPLSRYGDKFDAKLGKVCMNLTCVSVETTEAGETDGLELVRSVFQIGNTFWSGSISRVSI